MSPSKNFEEVPASHSGDKILRHQRRHRGIFRRIRRASLKLIGKVRR